MMTKKEKVLHEIAVSMKGGDNMGPAAILAGATHAAAVGGSFSAKDVAEIMRYCAQVALGVDGVKAARELSREYEKSVLQIRRECREAVVNAEDRAENEYERAREEFGKRAEEAEERLDEYRDDAEELENMKDAIGEDLWEALTEMVPEDRRLPQDTAELVEAVRRCGRSVNFGQYAMAV